MSYILDALKRADRERNRGAVPDIHAQADARPLLTAHSPIGTMPWLWIGLGALLSVAAVLLWLALQPASPVPTTALTGGRAVTSAATTAAAATATLSAPASWPAARPVAAPVVAPVAAAAMAIGVAPVVAPVLPPVLPPILPPIAPSATPVKAAPFLPPPNPPASAAVPAPGQDSKPAPAPKTMALQAAPEEVRRQLTALKLAGGVHSQRAADRLLIVDGQVVREGDAVAAGVVLEQIQPRSAIFRVRDQRVEVPF